MKLTTAFSIVLPFASIFACVAAKANPAPNTTIFNPSGYGAEKGTIYLNADYQSRTRFTKTSDGELGIGVGIGDADQVAIDFNYTVNSFGANNNGDKLGEGGFSIKAHKRLSDDSSVAIGYNQFAKVGTSDYQSGSYYVTGTKVFATQDKLSKPFSRVAVTAGVGGGVFNKFDSTKNPNDSNSTLSPFASVAVRVAEPVSAILEWTGQDFAAGVSITPFKDVPLTITPAVRDIGGAGDGSRFVLGVGYSFKF